MAKAGFPDTDRIRASEAHRTVYSQVQQWSVSDTEVIITFARVEPIVGSKGGKLKTTGVEWVNEVTVCIPISQAKTMCEILGQTIEQHFASKNSH